MTRYREIWAIDGVIGIEPVASAGNCRFDCGRYLRRVSESLKSRRWQSEEETAAKHAGAGKALAALAHGRGINRAWADEALDKLGCEFKG